MTRAYQQQDWHFTDVTEQAGLVYSHDYSEEEVRALWIVAGGVAAGDYDNDGWVDLYVERGTIGWDLLFRNQGDGTFAEVGAETNLSQESLPGSGPLFFDYNGDGWLDIFIGNIDSAGHAVLLRNVGDGTFIDETAGSGLDIAVTTVSATAGDYNRDGWLDLFLCHWNERQTRNHLWKNLGDGRFIEADAEVNFVDLTDKIDFTFAANFTDLNADGFPDLIISADFGTSRVFLNQAGQQFNNVTTNVLSDENGMGSAVGDYDNDGDLDWFVTSIWDEDGVAEGNWGITGNRLYQNRGDGRFEDLTDAAGVRFGYWGWGASFADLNNDGFLDLVHVNGWPRAEQFENDPSPLFISNGDGTFTDRSVELGFDDSGQGRGIVCFDFDRDGDLDIFVANNRQSPKLWRNEGGNVQNYLNIRLSWRSPNVLGIGSVIRVVTDDLTQMREVRCGSNYVSQNPAEAHFGLGDAKQADLVEVTWPDGSKRILRDVLANQRLTVEPLLETSDPRSVGVAPSAFDLAQNYPNPFNPTTNISYDVPTAGHIELKIYNTLGQEIRTLVDSMQPVGAHQAVWDGRDNSGNLVSSGLFFYRLKSGSFVETCKMILIR